MKTFYRLTNLESKESLWYNYKKEFIGAIHTKFGFCKSQATEMEHDSDMGRVGFHVSILLKIYLNGLQKKILLNFKLMVMQSTSSELKNGELVKGTSIH